MNIFEDDNSLVINEQENIFIDKINNLVQTNNSIFRFNEISHINLSHAKDEDNTDIFNIHIVKNNELSIFIITIYNGYEKSSSFANKLCSIFNVKLYDDVDKIHKEKYKSIKFSPPFIYVLMGITLISPYLFYSSFYEYEWFRKLFNSFWMVIYIAGIFGLGIFVRIKYGGYKNGKKQTGMHTLFLYRVILIVFSIGMYLYFKMSI